MQAMATRGARGKSLESGTLLHLFLRTTLVRSAGIRSRVAHSIVSTVFLLIGLSPAFGDTVTVGLPSGDAGNCIPFGCAELFGLNEFQQVYSAASFPGDVLITSLTFFQDETLGGVITNHSYSVRLSTTSAAVGGLDTTNLSNNIGSDDTLFFQGPLEGAVVDGELSVSGIPFLYAASKGNLLLDITISSSGFANGFAFFDQSLERDTTSSTFNAPGGTNAGALITRFTYTPVPEPSAWLVLGLSVATLASVAVCRRYCSA